MEEQTEPPSEGSDDEERAAPTAGDGLAYATLQLRLWRQTPIESWLETPGSRPKARDWKWAVSLLPVTLISIAAVASPSLLGPSEASKPGAWQVAAVPGASDPAGQAVSKYSDQRWVSIRAEAVNFRAEPSLQGAIIGRLLRDQMVLTIAESGDWTSVRLPNDAGTTGWVYSPLLRHE